MGSFADGVISQKGHIHGIIPAFLEDREVAHKGVTQLTITDSMHERKTLMYEPADGFLILPGGLGTLDETMEVLTWRQLNKLDGPVFTFSIDGYWEPMRSLLSGGNSSRSHPFFVLLQPSRALFFCFRCLHDNADVVDATTKSSAMVFVK